MIAALASASFVSRSGFAAVRRAMPKAALPLIVEAAVFTTCTLANVPGVWLEDPADSAGAPALVAPAELAEQVELSPAEAAKERRARARCETCGVVVAIQRVEPAGELPAAYEFTVRLRDGTLRTRRAASAGNWRSGDRIMLLGGAKSSSEPQPI